MDIEFYQDHRGKYPVRDYIDELSDKTELNQITAYLRYLKEQGFRLQRPVAAPLKEGIYELRPGHNRILYGFVNGAAVLLHALRKTRNEIPGRDIDLAIRRLEQWKRK